MCKSVWLRFIFVNAFFCAVLSSSSGHATSPVLLVRISINQDSLSKDFYRNSGTFWIDTRVKNLNSQNQTITVWTQSGWSWISDNPAIFPGIEALKNSPTKILLKPGEDYRSGVEAHSDRRKIKPITFRLGFVPNTDLPAMGVKGIEKRGDVVWQYCEADSLIAQQCAAADAIRQ